MTKTGEEANHQDPSPLRDQALMRAILDTTVDGIITIDHLGTILSFNAAAESIFGYQTHEVVGRNVSILMPSPEREEHDEYIARYLASREAHIIGIGREVTARRKSGETFPLDLAVSEVIVDGHHLFTAITRDITARKRVETALREEQDFVSAVLRTVGALIVVLDPQGRIVRFNRACELTTGYTFAEVRGSYIWERFTLPEESAHAREVFSDLKAGHASNKYESHWHTKTGGVRCIAWSNTVLLNAHGELAHIIGTGIDITDRRRAEEAIVSVSETERQIVGQELHDALGQQLTGIALLAKALERKLKSEEHGSRNAAAEITSLAQAAVREAKRLAQGLYPPELEKHGLSTALEELADLQRRVYNLDCRYDGPAEMPSLDKTTALHLYRIAQEAANNAVRHAGAGHLWIRLAGDRSGVGLTIEDDGCGLPESRERGRGMGLAIMQYRAQMAGGTFSISRGPAGGTLVACALPPPDAV